MKCMFYSEQYSLRLLLENISVLTVTYNTAKLSLERLVVFLANEQIPKL